MRMYVDHNRTMAQRISKIGSGFIPDWFCPEQIILVQDWFGPEQIIIGSGLVRTSYCAYEGMDPS